MLIQFTVPGNPIGAPRMTRADAWKGRECVLKYWKWKDAAREAAGDLPPVDKIESVSWVAVFSPPASWPKKRRQAVLGTLHRSKPDRDNIDKALLDALFPQDQGIAAGSIEKRWGIAEGLIVTIEVQEAT